MADGISRSIRSLWNHLDDSDSEDNSLHPRINAKKPVSALKYMPVSYAVKHNGQNKAVKTNPSTNSKDISHMYKNDRTLSNYSHRSNNKYRGNNVRNTNRNRSTVEQTVIDAGTEQYPQRHYEDRIHNEDRRLNSVSNVFSKKELHKKHNMHSKSNKKIEMGVKSDLNTFNYGKQDSRNNIESDILDTAQANRRVHKKTYRVNTERKNEITESNTAKNTKSVKNAEEFTDNITYPQMRFIHLQNLVSKEPSEIVLTLSNPKNGFLSLLQQEQLSRDMCALVLIALGQSCRSPHRNNVLKLINFVSQEKNFMFLSLQRYLVSFQNSLNKDIHIESFEHLLEFLQCFQQSQPASASEIISIVLPLLKSTCQKVFANSVELEKIMKKISDVENQKDCFIEHHTIKDIKKSSEIEKAQFVEPPESYRCLPVLPNEQDMKEHSPFLRPIIINGRYQDTEHYLDVQYRLLREDYVRPLREGIAKYRILKQSGSSVRNCKDVRFYENFHVVKHFFENGGLFHLAEFNIEEFKSVRWESSKRFLTGSLLCLSADNFESMLFAVVAFRNCEHLKQGKILLKFQDSEKCFDINPLTNFVAIETDAYFEAYYHNLVALQQIKQDFPLKNYIVDVNPTVNKPAYLHHHTVYDIRPLLFPLDEPLFVSIASLDGHSIKQYDFPSSIPYHMKSIQVLNGEQWPTQVELNLDESQYQALKAAVTKEFVVIQGPPGTGKTYIGLRILQLLLHNTNKWDSVLSTSSPVLVVCYTNHALDQFLEGALAFTDKIIRVGGRCSNEKLNNFKLHNVKIKGREAKSVPHHVFAGIKTLKYTLHCLKNHINSIQKEIERSFKMILNEEFLRQYMSESQYDCLKKANQLYFPSNVMNEHPAINDWLGINALYIPGNENEQMSTPETLQDSSEARLLTVQNAKGQSDVKIISRNKQANHFNAENTTVLETNRKITEMGVINTANINNLAKGSLQEDSDGEEEADIEYIEGERVLDPENFLNINLQEAVIDDWQEVKNNKGNTDGWKVQGKAKKLNEYIIKNLKNGNVMSEDEAAEVKDLWQLSFDDKWRLYRYWFHCFINAKQNECVCIQKEISQHIEQLKEFENEEDILLLRKTQIVGMTTTGAAKYRNILQNLNPKIIIIEEAAEILESHIVTSLCQDTQHLILIGDHQQLQPSPTVHDLAVKFNLNISLFERMIKNGMECYRLSVQHRMRPTIAALLVPHIYPDLINHDSVCHFENIKGVTKNVFFLSHTFMEEQHFDSRSRVNQHEARFIIEFCKYLLLQGYSASQITILTAYSGQLFALKKLSKSKFFEGVRITVVDNFQGEENDIILISFVRSNEEGNIGFLKIANRVCVALSRARKGLYCIGNFQLLAEKCSLWKKILAELESQQAVGPVLQLRCQNHPDVFTNVNSCDDFRKVPEGGCTLPCEFRLTCGHVCSRMCHSYDILHEKVKCLKPCTKTCEVGHKCSKACHQECGPCKVLVKKQMPVCLHEILIPCSKSTDDVSCTNPCKKVLICGHVCQKTCGSDCTKACEQMVLVNLPCGHEKTVKCFKAAFPDKLLNECKMPCNAVLKCGHACKGTCGACFQGRFHRVCSSPCNRLLVCGHKCKAPCGKNCPPCSRKCENKCIHSKCPLKCCEVCDPCKEPCFWSCEHQKCTELCSEPCNRIPCDEPCKKLLKCKHQCIGLCGEPCPQLCSICNEKEVKDIFFGSEDETDAKFIKLEDCKHVFEVKGLTQWMNLPDKEIQMKVCPKCKTAIRKNLRFGNIIKSCIEKIENVKKKFVGDPKENMKKLEKIVNHISEFDDFNEYVNLSSVELFLQRRRKVSHSDIVRCENLLKIADEFVKVRRSFEEVIKSNQIILCIHKFNENELMPKLEKLMDFFKDTTNVINKFFKQEFEMASDQQFEDITWEIQRLKAIVDFFSFLSKHTNRESCDEIQRCYFSIFNCLCNLSAFREEQEKTFITICEELYRFYGKSQIRVTDSEKKLILKAMHLTQGHWYQCPNGHVYCITECGGAMELSKCNECGASIGGMHHTLRSDNRVATDMDGAQHSAWSEYQNMLNYNF